MSAAAARLGADGGDEVELLFASGEGMALRPLARAASGGELSRVVLALEVVLAAGLGPASMVFDEVDAGIGGEAALEVGRRLAVLGRSRQVICVTHLPQVAAFADRHLLVAKSGRGAAVHSGVRVLEQHAAGPGAVAHAGRCRRQLSWPGVMLRSCWRRCGGGAAAERRRCGPGARVARRSRRAAVRVGEAASRRRPWPPRRRELAGGVPLSGAHGVMDVP